MLNFFLTYNLKMTSVAQAGFEFTIFLPQPTDSLY